MKDLLYYLGPRFFFNYISGGWNIVCSWHVQLMQECLKLTYSSQNIAFFFFLNTERYLYMLQGVVVVWNITSTSTTSSLAAYKKIWKLPLEMDFITTELQKPCDVSN